VKNKILVRFTWIKYWGHSRLRVRNNLLKRHYRSSECVLSVKMSTGHHLCVVSSVFLIKFKKKHVLTL
jgi:hypothetical protein